MTENINLVENKITENVLIKENEIKNNSSENTKEEKTENEISTKIDITIIEKAEIIEQKKEKENIELKNEDDKKEEIKENSENIIINTHTKNENINDEKVIIKEQKVLKEKNEKKIEININKIFNKIDKKIELNATPIIKNYEVEGTGNYFYNDQVNVTYKLSDYKIRGINLPKNKQISIFNLEKSDKKENTPKNKNLINYLLKGDIIKNRSELDFISNRIHRNKYKINLNLLYKASKDGDKSLIFHEKCDKAQTTLILVETKSNKRFGGYTKRTWRGSNIEKSDNEAFIFSLNKYKIYDVIKEKNAIGCYKEYNPYFTGAFKIYDYALNKGGCLINNEKNFEINDIKELIGEENCNNNGNDKNNEINFEIKEIEVYEIKIA